MHRRASLDINARPAELAVQKLSTKRRKIDVFLDLPTRFEAVDLSGDGLLMRVDNCRHTTSKTALHKIAHDYFYLILRENGYMEWLCFHSCTFDQLVLNTNQMRT